MFTIREEQSYEYESEGGSACRAKWHESHIEELSTIKADRTLPSHPPHCHSSSGSGNCCLRTNDGGLTRVDSHRSGKMVLWEQQAQDVDLGCLEVEDWEQKVREPSAVVVVAESEAVAEEDICVLHEGEKALKLPLVLLGLTGKPKQIGLSSTNSRQRWKEGRPTAEKDQRPKVRKNIDLVYTCSEERLREIRAVLEQEGVQLVEQEWRRDKENNRRNEADTFSSRGKKGLLQVTAKGHNAAQLR